MNVNVIEMILEGVLFVTILVMCGFFAKYLKDYKIFQMLAAKFKGDIYEYDRIHREQMKRDIEEHSGIFASSGKNRIPFLSKIYKRIEMTGVKSLFPAFSELMFLILAGIVGLIILFLSLIFASAIVGIISVCSYFILLWYGCGIIAYNRKLNAESQLLQFTNSTASASRQYAAIIDIIGAIYDQFEGPFREALQACYVEAKKTNDNDMAFRHLKEKFDSVQLAFVIDNLVMCSASTGDYYTVATDLSKTVSIFSVSHERKATTLRNARINISVMFVLAIIILFGLGIFFGNGISAFTDSVVGNLLCIVLALVYIFGMSIRAD